MSRRLLDAYRTVYHAANEINPPEATFGSVTFDFEASVSFIVALFGLIRVNYRVTLVASLINSQGDCFVCPRHLLT